MAAQQRVRHQRTNSTAPRTRHNPLASINSFDRLTDPVALAVQPLHVRLDKAPRAMSLAEFNAQLPSSIALAELALINGMDENTPLRAGQLMKRVIGTPVTRISNSP